MKSYSLVVFEKIKNDFVCEDIVQFEESSFYKACVYAAKIMNDKYKGYSAHLYTDPVCHVWRDGYFSSNKVRYKNK